MNFPVQTLMNEWGGWEKFSCDRVILWFKGHLLDSSVDQLHATAISYSRSRINISGTAEWVKKLHGNFSIVIETPDWIFAAVDKVCSIPLFYLESENQIVVGNYAPQLKEHAQLLHGDLEKGAILEIAMSGYTIGNKTIYKGIYQLTAGECLLITKGTLQRSFYFTYSPWKVIDRSEKQLQKEMTDSMLESLESMVESVKGRQIVIPLSAGSDSRLIASGLKHLGVIDVSCFAYGRPGNFESTASKAVAERLGYAWTEVPLSSTVQQDFFLSNEFKEFKESCDTYAATPHIQEVNAIGLLKKSGVVSSDAVIVNGNTGDFISGGHIPLSLHGNHLKSEEVVNLYNNGRQDFLDKHFTLWKTLRDDENDQYILNVLDTLFRERYLPDLGSIDVEHMHGLFECAEYLGRQSKYIIGMQRAYEFHGYGWRMPLWSESVLKFWESVPRSYKIGQYLYKKTLVENNWGGAWQGMPVNRKPIQPAWLIPLRIFSKALLFPLGREVWHQFERNAFQYFLDVTRNSVVVPYKKVLCDQRGQRHVVSWLSEAYLKQHCLDHTSELF
jgi:asparagine synthase (glutamine-hydrolysing)